MSEALSPRVMARAGLLCLVAGYVDAIGYTTLGRVFAANMTGNTVLLAIAAAEGDARRAAGYAATLAAFLAGAVAAVLLGRATGRPMAALAAASLFVLAAALAPLPSLALLALLAIAMGLQSAAITRFGAAQMQTVVVTATMIRLANRIAAYAVPRLAEPQTSPARLDALAWVAYGVGAALAVLAARAMRAPLVIAAVALMALALEAAYSSDRRR